MSEVMTIRVDRKTKSRLDKLAKAMDRTKSYVAAEAIRAYVELNEWQIAETEAALKEADASKLAPWKSCECSIVPESGPGNFNGAKVVARKNAFEHCNGMSSTIPQRIQWPKGLVGPPRYKGPARYQMAQRFGAIQVSGAATAYMRVAMLGVSPKTTTSPAGRDASL